MENFDYKKSLGQNFIYDKNLLNSFCNDAQIDASDDIIEIGAGAGTLTECLAEKANSVLSFEIDKRLFENLNLLKNKHNNLDFVFADFLKYDLTKILKVHDKKFKVVANIPYYITGPIIEKLTRYREYINCAYLLMQKEVADKLVCKVGEENYSASTILLQTFADVKILRNVGKKNFTPPPKVDSAFVEIKFKSDINVDYDEYSKFLFSCFSMRRKTLLNNLATFENFDKLKAERFLNNEKLKINIRPQEIIKEKFLQLFLNFKKIIIK